MPFAKHETFYIRDGWLHKGIHAILENKYVFLDEEAPEQLGLGKNMVRSLRFWMQATGLSIEEFQDRRRAQTLTSFGDCVLQYDPYQELDGTLWLLHHHLIANDEFTTAWYWFFNHYVPSQFTYREFIARLSTWVNIQVGDTQKVAESSLRKDFDCLVKTYLPGERHVSPEDILESPLSALGLLSAYSDIDGETSKKVRYYRFETGISQTIHPLVVLYVLLKTQERNRKGARQVSLQAALREPHNVGRTFNIKPTSFEDALSALNDTYPEWGVQLIRTGGLDQLTLPGVPADEVLRTYYLEQMVAVDEVQTWSRPLMR